jgi:hypothetical protein
MSKKFSQELHDKFDSKAREKAIEFFTHNGHSCTNNKNIYDIDLIVDNDYYLDVEVKTCWNGSWDNFTFSELNIPDRKEKYLNLDKPSYFMVISNDYSHAFIVPGEILKQCKKKLNPNKFNKNEEFFKVPVKKCYKIKL